MTRPSNFFNSNSHLQIPYRLPSAPPPSSASQSIPTFLLRTLKSTRDKLRGPKYVWATPASPLPPHRPNSCTLPCHEVFPCRHRSRCPHRLRYNRSLLMDSFKTLLLLLPTSVGICRTLIGSWQWGSCLGLNYPFVGSSALGGMPLMSSPQYYNIT